MLRDLLPPLLKEDTLVVLIQNGIGVEQDVEQQFPGIQLAAGLAFICSAKTEPGRVNHQCYGQINLGNYSCKDEGRVEQVAAARPHMRGEGEHGKGRKEYLDRERRKPAKRSPHRVRAAEEERFFS